MLFSYLIIKNSNSFLFLIGQLSGKHTHCQSPFKTRFRADEANEAFRCCLQKITLKPEYADTYLNLFDAVTKQEDGDRKIELQKVEQIIKDVDASLLKANRMFIEEKIDIDSYNRLKKSYSEDLIILKQKEVALQEVNKDLLEQLEFAFKVMSNLQKLWNDLDLEGKRLLVG